jgi:hypothetical protein
VAIAGVDGVVAEAAVDAVNNETRASAQNMAPSQRKRAAPSINAIDEAVTLAR